MIGIEPLLLVETAKRRRRSQEFTHFRIPICIVGSCQMTYSILKDVSQSLVRDILLNSIFNVFFLHLMAKSIW